MFPITLGRLLVGTAVLGIVGLLATVVTPDVDSEAEMYLEPNTGVTILGTPFYVTLIVRSDVPVNAFSGLISFDPTKLRVIAIDYNTGIADLWVEKPWYEDGDGTVSFAGGTTKPGGFSGEDQLIKIAFMPETEGDARLILSRARILEHNGFGTDAELATPIDALFSVERLTSDARTVSDNVSDSTFTIVPEQPSTDLNGDGKVNVADISIMMIQLTGNDLRYDLNLDAKVNLGDLSILLDERS